MRLRTALTTLVVFGACVSLPLLLGLLREDLVSVPDVVVELRRWSSAAEVEAGLRAMLAEVGLLVLPGNRDVLGVAAHAVAGVAFLLAIQPALVAARSAPRLWGWLLVAWLLGLVLGELLHVTSDVGPDDLWLAPALLPSALVVAVGLGTASTARTGPRRPWVAWIVAVLFCVLGHGNARPFATASRAATHLRADVLAAMEVVPDRVTFVVDPPEPSGGFDPIADALPALVHPGLVQSESDVPAQTLAPRVRGVSREALLAFMGEPEFRDTYLTHGLLIVYPREALGEEAGVGGLQRRPYRLLEAPVPSQGTRSWRGDRNSRQLDLEPLLESALRVRAPAGTDLESLRAIEWNARGSSPPLKGSWSGTWTPAGDRFEGLFDLGASLPWRLAGRVIALRFPEGIGPLDSVEVLPELPGLEAEGAALAPLTREDDWVFAAPERPAPDGAFVLGLLHLDSLQYQELDVVEEPGGLRAPGAERICRRETGSFAWLLDYRIQGRNVARVRGRR